MSAHAVLHYWLHCKMKDLTLHTIWQWDASTSASVTTPASVHVALVWHASAGRGMLLSRA
eukprot:1824003-Amphidinium_carterae.2